MFIVIIGALVFSETTSSGKDDITQNTILTVLCWVPYGDLQSLDFVGAAYIAIGENEFYRNK
jgi:hypothetical protein